MKESFFGSNDWVFEGAFCTVHFEFFCQSVLSLSEKIATRKFTKKQGSQGWY